jgi:hypothetical protein
MDDGLKKNITSSKLIHPTFGEFRHHLNARQVLAKIKESRKGKKFKLVKISSNPNTWKEVEV